MSVDWSWLEREQGIGNREQCGEMGRWGDGEMGRWGDREREEVVFNN
ncbi:MAG: hypothetical protein F6J94_21730 [Moorea sp. SIO1F2]|nr:hypothetical protein [Moorena sp. SIO1F2]